MPGPAIRVGDNDDAEGDAITGSPNVFINDIPAHKMGDEWLGPDGSYNADSGSSNVFVNDLPKCSVGDSTTLPSTMASGSPNVFIND